MELTTSDSVRDIRQGKTSLCTQALLTLQLFTLVSNLTCLLLCLHNMEGITSCWCTIQTEDDCRLCWSSTLDALVTLIEHSLDTTPWSTSDNIITNLQSTIRYKNRTYITTTLIKWRLNDSTCSLTVRVSFEIHHISLKKNFIKKFVHSDTLLSTDFLTLILTTPLFHEQIHLWQVLTNLIRVSSWLINLIDCKYHRNTCCLCMSNSLLGSRHHRVVCSNDDNHNISNLCTTSTHSSKCFVTRSIKEGNLASVLKCHTIGTDVLGNTTCLTSNYIRITDMVEQRSLTMVNMTHDSHDWSTWHEIVLVILLFTNSFLYFGTYIFCLKVELISNKVDSFCIKTLVDRHHDTDRHQGWDDICYRNVHHCCQLWNSNKLCQLQYLTFLALCLSLCIQTLLNSITLLFTVFSTLLILTLACQTCKCLLYLACYSLIINL